MGTISEDKVTMDLVNTYNYGYIGEFYLGSGSPQKNRVMFDTGSANSWILSKQARDLLPKDNQEEHECFD